MSNELQPLDLATFFASLDRRLDERDDPEPGEVDEVRRDLELVAAELDKALVLLGYGEGDLELPIGRRVGERLRQLDDAQWSAPATTGAVDPSPITLLDHVRGLVNEAGARLRG